MPHGTEIASDAFGGNGCLPCGRMALSYRWNVKVKFRPLALTDVAHNCTACALAMVAQACTCACAGRREEGGEGRGGGGRMPVHAPI